MKEIISIPKDRLGVLNKKMINLMEKKINVSIKKIGNSIEIDGDGLDIFQAKNIVKAIGRGFSPYNAFLLLENKQLDVIEIPGKNLRRIKARIIGTKGKTRKNLEGMTGCLISVYGKTVSIIGDYEKIALARKAIEMFINGASHSSVYKFLLKQK